jgi:hypothetical protein
VASRLRNVKEAVENHYWVLHVLLDDIEEEEMIVDTVQLMTLRTLAQLQDFP